MNESEACQYYYKDMVEATLPDSRLALPLRRRWWNLKRDVWYLSVLGPQGFVRKMLPHSRLRRFAPNQKPVGDRAGRSIRGLNLRQSEIVEVRSVKEIFATLNGEGKLRGLRFTPEMQRFCGRRFRVYKTLERIVLEATGELRKIRTPTVLLEGVFCDGSAHGGCDRSCFCFWREEWLKKVASQSPAISNE
jgi:hypothetical protein